LLKTKFLAAIRRLEDKSTEATPEDITIITEVLDFFEK
jgi:hypothetical protein